MKTHFFLMLITTSTSALACKAGEVITAAGKLQYECDHSVSGLVGFRDPRGVIWGKPGLKNCGKIEARRPTEKEVKVHNEELGVKETGDRCVKSVIHHYHTFPKTPPTPYTAKELDFYREEDAYGEFSNFAGFPVFMDGEWWSTSEHYYQAQKYETQELKDWVHFAPTPMEAANRGRDPKVPKRKDWDQVKDGFMKKVLVEKFNRHSVLKELLLSTKNAHIYEHTTNDCYWADCGDRTGKNRLGVQLMEIRESLR